MTEHGPHMDEEELMESEVVLDSGLIPSEPPLDPTTGAPESNAGPPVVLGPTLEPVAEQVEAAVSRASGA